MFFLFQSDYSYVYVKSLNFTLNRCNDVSNKTSKRPSVKFIYLFDVRRANISRCAHVYVAVSKLELRYFKICQTYFHVLVSMFCNMNHRASVTATIFHSISKTPSYNRLLHIPGLRKCPTTRHSARMCVERGPTSPQAPFASCWRGDMRASEWCQSEYCPVGCCSSLDLSQ